MPRKPRPQTIQSTAEFARYVGLARTTVSRVLNGHAGLKPKTIERVRRAMVETGFSRNAFALHLRGKKTASIGICLESLLRLPSVLKLATLQSRLRERRYSSLIEVVDRTGTSPAVARFLSMRVEAVAFIGYFAEAELTERIAELSRLGIPHILIDHTGIPGAHSVSLDRHRAMAELTRHLLGLGHRSFGLLGISEPYQSTADRLQGIGDALRERGLTLEEATVSLDHLHPRGYNYEFGRALARSFASRRERPTAFLSLNDEIGAGAIRGFQEAGLAIPGDLSVTGFNNLDLCLVSHPQLTSVDQQIGRTVDRAVNLLFAQIDQPRAYPAKVELIEPEVILRDSIGPAAPR